MPSKICSLPGKTYWKTPPECSLSIAVASVPIGTSSRVETLNSVSLAPAVPLLLRLLGRPTGFTFLESTGFVERVRAGCGLKGGRAGERARLAHSKAAGAPLTVQHERDYGASVGTCLLVPAGERRLRATCGSVSGTRTRTARQH